jgi:renalase
MAASAGRDFAIIGAGVAGVSCAAALSRGLADGDAEVETRVHLIDQGSRGIGGRASSSRPTAHDEPIAFDHGCQFFTARTEAFKREVSRLERLGHVRRWDGRFGTVDALTGAFERKPDPGARDDDGGDGGDDGDATHPAPAPTEGDFFGLLASEAVYVGVPTMRGLCDGLRLASSDAVVDRAFVAVTSLETVPIPPTDPTDPTDPPSRRDPVGPAPRLGTSPRWIARGVDHRALDRGEAGSDERALGEYAGVVVTDVMLAKRGTPGSCRLVGAAEGSEAIRAWTAMAESKAESLFTVFAAFDVGESNPAAADFSAVPFDAAVVSNSPVVQLLVRDDAKPGRGRGRAKWVGVSTAAFAARVVAGAPLSRDGTYNPQTAEYLAAVTPEMCDEVRRILGLASASRGGPAAVPEPAHVASQRWGHAFPAAPVVETRDGHAWAASEGFGACGDFVNGAGVEAAWLSGASAGAAIAKTYT